MKWQLSTDSNRFTLIFCHRSRHLVIYDPLSSWMTRIILWKVFCFLSWNTGSCPRKPYYCKTVKLFHTIWRPTSFSVHTSRGDRRKRVHEYHISFVTFLDYETPYRKHCQKWNALSDLVIFALYDKKIGYHESRNFVDFHDQFTKSEILCPVSIIDTEFSAICANIWDTYIEKVVSAVFSKASHLFPCLASWEAIGSSNIWVLEDMHYVFSFSEDFWLQLDNL